MEIKKCTRYDSEYPNALKNYSQAPETLYYVGDISLCNKKMVCVIGKRETSRKALDIARGLGMILADNGITVINGIARGCDAYALKGCVEHNGKAVCVMPCGLDIVYPASNKNLYEQIVATGGCAISEYPIGVQPHKSYFLKRDKIQAMLASRLIVVDSNETGGTSFTVEMAVKYGKKIGCCKFSEMGDGNAKFLVSPSIIPISSTDDVYSFINMVDYEQMVLNFA